MTTDRQRAANRQNARSSTGPRTTHGRASSGRNNTRHGLRSQSPVIGCPSRFCTASEDRGLKSTSTFVGPYGTGAGRCRANVNPRRPVGTLRW